MHINRRKQSANLFQWQTLNSFPVRTAIQNNQSDSFPECLHDAKIRNNNARSWTNKTVPFTESECFYKDTKWAFLSLHKTALSLYCMNESKNVETSVIACFIFKSCTMLLEFYWKALIKEHLEQFNMHLEGKWTSGWRRNSILFIKCHELYGWASFLVWQIEDSNHGNDPKFSYKQVWANSVDPGISLIRVYTVCHFVCILWMHFSLLCGKATFFKL